MGGGDWREGIWRRMYDGLGLVFRGRKQGRFKKGRVVTIALGSCRNDHQDRSVWGLVNPQLSSASHSAPYHLLTNPTHSHAL